MIRHKEWLMALLAMTGVTAVTAEAACKAPTTPAGMNVQLVAEEMKVNGVPMAVRTFTSTQGIEEVLAYYRQLWAGLANSQRPGYRENMQEPWQMISTVDGDCFTVVQIQANAKGSNGLISIAERPRPQQKLQPLGADVPVLPGSRLLNDFDYADGIRNARTLVYSNNSNLAANVNYYRNEFAAKGWVALTDSSSTRKGQPSHVMVMKKGVAEASVVLTQAGGQTQVVTNVVDRP